MKHQIIVTAVITFDVNPNNYPDSDSDEERLAVDMENLDDDIFAYLDGENVEWSFEGKVLP